MHSSRVLPLAAALAVGCTTVGGMRSMPLDQGVERRFQADLVAVALAARNAIAASPLGVPELTAVGDSAWVIIARPVVRSDGATELVRVVCQQLASGEVAVRVATRRRSFFTSVIRSDWSETLF